MIRPKRPYRFVTRAYPPYHRRQHGPELIETALALRGGRWSIRESLSFLGRGLAKSARIPRRLWGLAAIPAIAYGPVLILAEIDGDSTSGWASLGWASLGWVPGSLHDLAWLLKLFTVAGLPIVLYLLVERIGERPARWRRTAAIWPVVGVASVLILSLFRADHARRVTNVTTWSSYPGGPEISTGVLQAANYAPAPSLATLLIHEVVAIIAIALVAARAARLGRAGAAAIPVVAFGGLIVYRVATPWSVDVDFDFFVGDTMLGGAFVELLFPLAPFDGFGALGISIAALVMSIQILAWGGACATDPRSRRAPTFAEAKMMQRVRERSAHSG